CHAWWDYSYLSRGRYAEQLERWLGLFPSEQLLVLGAEDLAAEPARAYSRVLDFLGRSPHELDSYPRVYKQDYAEMRPETRRPLARGGAGPRTRRGRPRASGGGRAALGAGSEVG